MKDSNECVIPATALEDPNRREILRAWVANKSLHVSLNIPNDWKDPFCWGIALTDVMRHLSDAYQKAHGISHEETIRRIQDGISAELSSPTSEATGDFVE